MKKIVYHGTTLKSAHNIMNKGINLIVGRKSLDFGTGFYTTENKGQAIKWAIRKSGIYEQPAIISFVSHLEEDLNIRIFSSCDHDWGDAVYNNRVHGIDILRGYDCVIAPLVDGNIRREVIDARNLIISKEEFVQNVSGNIGFQIVYKTYRSISGLSIKTIQEVR